MKRLLAVLSVLGCSVILPVGVAQADCDTPGDFGAGSGCPPPGSDSSGGGNTQSWPPTSVDWPPQFESAGGGSNEKSTSSPIVPDGEAAHRKSPATTVSTSTTPTPIVMPGG